MIDACPQPDYVRSTSVPEELSDEDPPTVTPTPVHGSPEGLSSILRSHQSTDGLLRPSSKEAHAQIIESGDEDLVSDQRSDIQEELEVEIGHNLEDQHSERLLKLEKEDRLDSRENLSTSKLDSPTISKEHPFVSLEQDKQLKTRESSESEEDVKSITASDKSHSAAVDLKTSQHASVSPSFSNHSRSIHSDAFSSKELAPIKDIEASSPMADGYHDDFESSVDSSLREECRSPKPASSISVSPNEIKDSPSRAMPFDNQDKEVEEAITEELSHHTGTSGSSHQTGNLLDLHKQTEDLKQERKSFNSSHSPPISCLQTSPSPVIDEMPSFNIGDRVLVGGVQPGTLRFKGSTSFANGFWAGVELDKSEGSNNGTYDGVVYFECDECHGIFAPPDKITHLPDKYETYTDTTEDEDSFFDDLSDKGGDKRKSDEGKSQKQGNLETKNGQTSQKDFGFGDKKVMDESVHPNHHHTLKDVSHLNSQHHKESKHPISNGKSGDIILNFEDAPTTLLISDLDRISLGKQSQKEITALVESKDVDSNHHLTPADISTDIRDDKAEQKEEKVSLDTFADQLLNNFVKDTVKQFAQIKKAKEQKIEAANQINGDLFENAEKEEEEWVSSVEQKDGLPFFLPAEKEELSSPELCNRPVSVD